VSEQTIQTWKKDETFSLALKKGKDESDLNVVESLYKRATGYEHEDIYFSNYEGAVSQTPYIKHYPPDPTSMIFWLKNRRKDEWRDRHDVEHSGEIATRNLTEEEREKRIAKLKAKLPK
jgi:hypothetical protein